MTPFEIGNLRVSKHAVTRWRERTGSKRPEFYAMHDIRQLLVSGRHQEMELLEQYRVAALLDHDFTMARYFQTAGGLLLVIIDSTIVTVHSGKAKRWRPKSA